MPLDSWCSAALARRILKLRDLQFYLACGLKHLLAQVFGASSLFISYQSAVRIVKEAAKAVPKIQEKYHIFEARLNEVSRKILNLF